MILTLDFETYFDKDHTLTKQSTSEYIRDSRFKVHGVGLKEDDGETHWYTDMAILKYYDWSKIDLLCHNCAFDGFILHERYGIHPRRYLDTLSMSRAIVPAAVGHSLEKLAVHFALGEKLKRVLESTKGMRDLEESLEAELGYYCCRDVDLTYALYHKLLPYMPEMEMDLIDTTLRMFCEPVLKIDGKRLNTELKREIGQKGAAVFQTGVTESDLASTAKFVELLQHEGVPIALKSGKRGSIPAVAKTDRFFQSLLVHSNPRVKALAEARLKIKSTITETRAKRLLMSKDTVLPVLLNYCGAHTTRWSGGDKMNLQNLPRDSEIRRSIKAPKDHMIVIADSAQIEARVLAWLAKHTRLLDAFRNKEDVYKLTAAEVLGIPVAHVDDEKRRLGKVLRLALGYGMGAPKLQDQLAKGTIIPQKIIIGIDEAARYVDGFRKTNPQIVRLWNQADGWLNYMAVAEGNRQIGVLKFERECVQLPNGLYLRYPNITGTEYRGKAGMVNIYGGLFVENLTQALARCIVAEQMWHLAKHWKIVSSSHDEIIGIAHKRDAKRALAEFLNRMAIPPDWAPDLPLDAEGVINVRYS